MDGLDVSAILGRRREGCHLSLRAPSIQRLAIVRTPASAFALAVAFSVLVVSTVHAETPEVVLDRPRVGEYQPVRGSGWLVWQQNTVKRPQHYDLFARPAERGSKRRINESGTSGANGDIEEGILVYQQFERRRSGLRLFDLATGERSTLRAVNTEHWEYWPSMSGSRLLFGRLQRNGTRRVILFDVSTRDTMTLAKTSDADAFLAPGQVNGDWAVWYRCRDESECNVTRYHIPTGAFEVLPNSGGRQHAPSVGRGGAVYFARAGAGCGRRVRIMRRPLDGPVEELWRLPNGDDIARTHVQRRRRGPTILYDHFSCGNPAQSDAWAISFG
jgi:hypothetical protein